MIHSFSDELFKGNRTRTNHTLKCWNLVTLKPILAFQMYLRNETGKVMIGGARRMQKYPPCLVN